jgi:hypothetical protein
MSYYSAVSVKQGVDSLPLCAQFDSNKRNKGSDDGAQHSESLG